MYASDTYQRSKFFSFSATVDALTVLAGLDGEMMLFHVAGGACHAPDD